VADDDFGFHFAVVGLRGDFPGNLGCVIGNLAVDLRHHVIENFRAALRPPSVSILHWLAVFQHQRIGQIGEKSRFRFVMIPVLIWRGWHRQVKHGEHALAVGCCGGGTIGSGGLRKCERNREC
jgi:hypothetical protein